MIAALAVIAAVQVVGGLTATLIANKKTPSDKAREKRMKKFNKAIRRGETGLDQAQKEQLVDVQRNVNQAVSREFFSREGELAALQGLSGGDLLAQQDAAEDAAVRREQGIGQVVAQADAVERQRQIAAQQGDALKQEAVEAQRRQNWANFAMQTAEVASSAVAAGYQAPATGKAGTGDAAQLAGMNLTALGGTNQTQFGQGADLSALLATMTPQQQQAYLAALNTPTTGGSF